jgi:hypothetical protein
MTSNVLDEPPHSRIFETIMKWGENQKEIIKWAWKSPGGWEGWAQVELYRTFGYSSSREDHAYNLSAKRTDLGFNTGPFVMGKNWGNVPQERVLLELKCEGANNRTKFKDGVRKDIEKIKGDINKEYWGEGGCTVYSIALSMSDDGHRDLEKLEIRNYNRHSKHNPPFQLWWKMRYITPDHFSNKSLPPGKAAEYTRMDKEFPGYPVSYK